MGREMLEGFSGDICLLFGKHSVVSLVSVGLAGLCRGHWRSQRVLSLALPRSQELWHPLLASVRVY